MTDSKNPQPEASAATEAAPQQAAQAEAAGKPARRTTARRTARKTAEKTVEKSVEKAGAPVAPKIVDVDDPSLYINREISWIEFDRKVLETAADPTVPLLQRVQFLAIFFNNLDEFYMVRVMNLQRQARMGAEPTGADSPPAHRDPPQGHRNARGRRRPLAQDPQARPREEGHQVRPLLAALSEAPQRA